MVLSQWIPQAPLAFTDVSFTGTIAAAEHTSRDQLPQQFVHTGLGLAGSLQSLELLAIHHVSQLTPEPRKLFTASIYCAQLVPQLPYAFCKLDYSSPLNVLIASTQQLLEAQHSPSLYNILWLIQTFLTLCHPLTNMWMPWHALAFFFSDCMAHNLHFQFH